MATVIVSPDFYSHFQPLSVVADALQRRGERVVVATGTTMRPLVVAAGLEWRHLDLAPGSNDGIADARHHDRSDHASLDAFIDSTRRGFVATLAFQASKRRRELLWNPVVVGRRIIELLDEVEPERIIVDQVSLVSTLGAIASGRPFSTLVPGHPTQLPVRGEQYGDAIAWPDVLTPDPSDLAELGDLVSTVNASVTASFNEALSQLRADARPVDDAFGTHGELVAYHWETPLHDPTRVARLPMRHVDLGPLVRAEQLPDEYRHLQDGGRPLVVIALGTFLVHRHDVLAAAIDAVRRTDARAVVAVGPHDPASFGPVPDDWVLAPRIPQVALLRHARCLISHGGNGSVQEALARGVRQILLPMSTDQMAVAADLVRVGRASAADANALDAERFAAVVAEQVDGEPHPPIASAVEAFVDQLDAGPRP